MIDPRDFLDPTEEETIRHRWREVDEDVEHYNAALEEWMRRGEEGQ